MAGRILIYGANGYIGRLTAKFAKKAGHRPVVAGRNAALVKAVADSYNFEWRVFDLTDDATIDRQLSDIDLVLHTAGPFPATTTPMLEACLRTGTHYLDIAGTIDVIETLSARFADAQHQGIMLLPGAGFDVAASDCLLAHLKRRLPGAQKMTLAIERVSTPSRGLAKSAIDARGSGPRIRRDARIETLRSRPRRDFDFGDGPVTCLAVEAGGVSSGYHSTAVPNIAVFALATPSLQRAARASAPARWLQRRALMRRHLKRRADAGPDGPSKEQRADGRARILGVAEDALGGRVASVLTTPDPLTLTAHIAIDLAVRAADGAARPGFFTPTRLLGPDYILGFDGVARTDPE